MDSPRFIGRRRRQWRREHPWAFPLVFDLRFPASGPAGFTIAGLHMFRQAKP
jgi:hypothetical protein